MFRPYQSSYYSIDAILMEETHTPLKFSCNLLGVAPMIRQEGLYEDIMEGEKAELPFWLVRLLAHKNFAHPIIPPVIGPSFQNKAMADSCCINLYKKCPYFYEYATEFLALPRMRRYSPASILTVVRHCFVERLLAIIDHACMNECQRNKFISNLATAERSILQIGNQSTASHNKWLKRKAAKLEPSDVIAMVKRRTKNKIWTIQK